MKIIFCFLFSFFPSTVSNSNMMTVNDIWQLSTTNSNTNYQSFYFPSSIDFNNANQYHHTTDNNHFDYQPSIDIPSTYLIDPNSHIFPNNYSMDPYPLQPVYNSTPIEPSTYITSTDSYPNLHSICKDSNVTLPSTSSSIDIQLDYQPTSSQWDSGTTKMPSDDGMYNKLTVFYIQKWMPICLFFFSLTNTKPKIRESMSAF